MSRYKALRFEPGIYTYENGAEVDCALENIIVKNVIGIKTFKMYMQTPPYSIGGEREKGDVGTLDNFFFENISVDLYGPIDCFPEYVGGDTERGVFAAFELGANIGMISFENVDFKHHGDEFPLSYLACIGPKSIVSGGKEVFDPYLCSRAEKMTFKNITVNGSKPRDILPLLRAIEFDNVNGDSERGYFALPFGTLLDFEEGKTVEDYTFGMEISVKEGNTVSVHNVALCKADTTVIYFNEAGDSICGETKAYTLK